MVDQIASSKEAHRSRRRLRSDGAEAASQEPAVVAAVLALSPCPALRSCALAVTQLLLSNAAV